MIKKIFTRTRDVFRNNIKPQQKVSIEEWTNISDLYVESEKLSKSKLVELLKEDLKNAEDIILQNKIHEVREVNIISELYQKVFVTPKKEQVDELVGRIKYIRTILNTITSWKSMKEDLEKREAVGQVVIDRDRKK